MSIQNLEEAFLAISQNFDPDECVFSSSKSYDFIEKAEKFLEVKFPNTYREFIHKCGFGGPCSLVISGIRTNQENELLSTGVVFSNLNKRTKFNHPKHLIAIEDIGDGSMYCLDTSQMNTEGECPVVVWQIGGYETTPELEVVAEDFGKFFLDMVQRQIEYKKQA